MARKKTTVAEKLSKITFDLDKIEQMASLGMTDVQIASTLEVTEQTLNNWKKDESFLLALKKGKDKSDAKVVESLYKRATGYSHDDIYFSSYQGEVTMTPYVKNYAPDPTSMIFWLKNRDKENWRDTQDITSGGSKIDSIEVMVVPTKKKTTD